ncbi:MAG: type IV pilus assembly protein PilQ [Gammaproteobacteria bacterium]|jgi:type IV pilus assembly protein PilQ
MSLATLLISLPVIAAELSGLQWNDTGTPVFSVVSSTPDAGIKDFKTEVLDNGYRLRVYFPGDDLAKNIRDIGAVGIVRGVFPYMTDEPTRANFDILLKTPGHLSVSTTATGYAVSIVEGAGETIVVEDADLNQPEIVVGVLKDTNNAISEPDAIESDTSEMSELEQLVLQEIQQQEQPAAVVEESVSIPVAAEILPVVAAEILPVMEKVAKNSTTSSNRPRIVLQPVKASKPEIMAVQELKPDVVDSSQMVEQKELDNIPDTAIADTAIADTAIADTAIADTATIKVEPQILVAQVNSGNSTLSLSTAEVRAPEIKLTSSEPQVVATSTRVAPEGSRTLSNIQYAQFPGGKLQINLNVNTDGLEPGVFRTNNPPRVIVDFFDTKNAVAETIQRVGIGAIESIVTAETDDRTRVILNLVAAVDFEQRLTSDGLVLVLESPSDRQLADTMRAKPRFDNGNGQRLNFSVTDIDFRRSVEGGGTVSIKLSSDEVGIDVREEAGEILIDLPGTSLPAALEKRLDVADFATPVQTIDTFFTGAGTRVIVSPVGQYSHSSYQVGDTLTLQINPPTALEVEREPDEFGYVGEKLSFNFQKITVRAALQVIADFTGLNFVTSDSVTGDLSLRLKDVPWDQALDTILQVKGLAKRQKGNVIWVAPAEEIAAKERQTFEAESQALLLEPLVSELIQVNYAKARELSEILKSRRAIESGVQGSLFGSVSVSDQQTDDNSLLSNRGSVAVDDRTNTLLVQDTRAKIGQIRKMIAKLDRPVRQVLIETRIVEANEDFSRNIGARLGFTRLTENARLPGTSDTNIGTFAGSSSIENNSTVLSAGPNSGNGISVNLGADGVSGLPAASYAFSLAKAGAGFAHLIDLEISALEAEGNGKVIANPRLLTTDQHEASIQQGQERVFTTSVLGEGGVVTKKAVLGLTVTPQITPDDRLILDVSISKDSFSAADASTINTKAVQTKVLLDNGETVVIGGIYEQIQAESTTKVPLLGDIPILGNLFKKRNLVDNRTELLIFLTPRILSPALTAQ